MSELSEINNWLTKPENYNLEFKEAKNQFSRNKIFNYCAALANECGGKLILGIDNKGKIVGTNAYEKTYTKLPQFLFEQLGLRVDVEEFIHLEGRLLIFHIPSYRPGQPIKANNIYWMRAGEALTAMDNDTLHQKLSEIEPDFSSEIVTGLKISDLDTNALRELKRRWAQKQQRPEYRTFTKEKALKALGLLSGKGLNYTALILLGKKDSLDEHLPTSEIIFEWRQQPHKITHDFRINWRKPLLNIYDEIWKTINDRNLRIPFQEGFIQREIIAFTEKPIREALINAVAHRDYKLASRSIVIKASPERFFIESPGGLLPGITIENILDQKAWRNRTLSEALEKIGLAERAGQGIDDIFEITISEGKGKPDLSKTDNFSVRLIIPAKVQDSKFILFLEKVANEKQITFSTEDLLELEKIRTIKKVSNLKHKDKFLHLGIIENVGRGRGSQYILSHRYYKHEGKTGIHTRLVGTSREKNKVLILDHFGRNKRAHFNDFQDIFPELSKKQTQNLLQELKKEGKLKFKGSRKFGFWHLKKQ